jgi:hypothetical protein
VGEEAIVAITQTALNRVRSFRADLPEPESQALWVRVGGSADGEYTYALTLNPRSGSREHDAVQHGDDLVIVVAGTALRNCAEPPSTGRDPAAQRVQVINPNKPPALGALPSAHEHVAPSGAASPAPRRPPRDTPCRGTWTATSPAG